jgi:asparagine synthase (glutamine-hydrolysing)
MNLAFRLAQLAQGFGQPAHRQSYHWMAPWSGQRLAGIWADGVLPPNTPHSAFAPIDELAREASCRDGRSGAADALIRQFLATYLPEDILTKTDRAAMFNGLEVRAPYLDRDFADYACALPATLKYRSGRGKYVLKQLARRYLPDRIVDRRKHGFGVPIDALLRSAFRDRCSDTLLDRSNPVSPWFRRDVLTTMIDQHMSGAHNHGKRLWALFVLFTVAARQSRRLRAEPRLPALHV